MTLLDRPVASSLSTDTWDPYRERFSPSIAHNDLVPEDVAADLKLALVQPRKELEDVQRTIKVLNLTLDALKRRCSDLEERIATYEPILSPMRRLPDDMLQEIFFHCLPTHRNPIPITSECPLLLTLVCRKWRSIAFASPRLWSNLHISFELEPQYYHRQDTCMWPLRIAGLHDWLTRSGVLPISLSLYCQSATYYNYDMWQPSFPREVLLVVKQHAHRLSSIEMRLSQDILNMMHLLIDIRADSFPSLKSIRHCPGYGSSNMTLKNPQALFSQWLTLPALREIHLATYCAGSHLLESGVTPMIWPALLTRLSIHVGSSSRLITSLLQQCTLLEECTLTLENYSPWSDVVNPSESWNSLPKIALPRLKQLSIIGEDEGPGSICGELEAPALTQFSYYPPSVIPGFSGFHANNDNNFWDSDHIPRPPHSPLLEFLSNCHKLDKLTINSARIRGVDFQAILEATPNVTFLFLDHCVNNTQRLYYTNDTRPERCPYGYNLYPLLKQELKSNSAETSVPLDKPLLPKLKTFKMFAHLQDNDTDKYHELLIDFCIKRIHPNPSPSSEIDGSTDVTAVSEPNAPTTASLEFIMITLDGVINVDAVAVEPEDGFIKVDIEGEVAKHVKSLGKKVGKDVVLDIAYPWTDAPPLLMLRDGPISPREGLDVHTDHTWQYVD